MSYSILAISSYITFSNFLGRFDFHGCFQVSCAVVRLLLEYGANPDLLCEGHSALSLGICSGNDLVRYDILVNHNHSGISLCQGVHMKDFHGSLCLCLGNTL